MILSLILGVMAMAGTVYAQALPGASVEALKEGGYLCMTPQYQARLGPDGSLLSLHAGGTDFLGGDGKSPAAGFIHAGQLIPMKAAHKSAEDTLVAEGAPKDSAKAVAGSPCPFTARVTYHFLPDRIELTLEQSLDQYGGFAWIPAAGVLASRDALTDCAIQPAGPALYGQTDPRWITKPGPVLRFDFGVWQRGFANASWGNMTADGKPVRFLMSTVPGTGPIKAVAFPQAEPGPQDALTFDISAADPDFLLPGGKPAHFDITVTNAGPKPVETAVRFEVRDYLTRKPVAAKPTQITLAPGATCPLSTDIPLTDPGPYRGAIVIEQAGKPVRDFGWVFTYDFQHYNPPTTRAPDFEQFWKDALAESAATPLDPKLTPVPAKNTATVLAYKVSFATLGGRRIYGYYAKPKAPGKYPVHVRFPSSGIYPLPGPEMSADRCSLWIQIHGFDVDLSNMPKGDDPGKGYWTAGIASPQTSMWRTIYISLVRAVDFMLAQPEVDPTRVAVVGGSQGGGLSMVAAALDHRIALSMPSHSGLPRLDWTVKYEPGYWPFAMNVKPQGQSEEKFLRTLSYFDPANFTQDIRCPIVAEVGLMDVVTGAGNQICALSHVPPGLLYLICSPWAMHGAGSRASNLGAECYARYLKGEKPILTPTK